jgi:hypothetical protein
MARNNSDRSGMEMPEPEHAEAPPVEAMAPGQGLNFVTPTEFVDLPSQGKYYPNGHPLHNEEVVEMRFMTAKEEDMLTSPALLKKGIAIDRMLQNLIVNPAIKVKDLLIGDKSAMILSARISAYGADYVGTVTCPACGAKVKHYFDLSKHSMYHPSEDDLAQYNVEATDEQTFKVTLPRTKVVLELRLLTSTDEAYIIQTQAKKKKHGLPESNTTDILKRMVISANGEKDKSQLSQFIESMPAFDARYLRSAIKVLAPTVDNKQEFACNNCGLEQDMEVPFGIEFFWPE